MVVRQRVKVKGDPQGFRSAHIERAASDWKGDSEGQPGSRAGAWESLGLELKASSGWRWTRGIVVGKLGDLSVPGA